MEEALRPGRYISEHASFTVVGELELVATRIAGADPERAVGLYETFIAACYEKADEVDDSSGYFGTFGGSLFARWVTARQAASADPADTVARLLTWMANDQYGFWSHVTGQAGGRHPQADARAPARRTPGPAPRRDKPSSDTARVAIRKTRFKPISRRSPHVRPNLPSRQHRSVTEPTSYRKPSDQVAQVFGTHRLTEVSTHP